MLDVGIGGKPFRAHPIAVYFLDRSLSQLTIYFYSQFHSPPDREVFPLPFLFPFSLSVAFSSSPPAAAAPEVTHEEEEEEEGHQL